jgi:GTP-binding protein HflX
VLVEDRLFSTLDATVRRLELSPGKEVLLSDTVGFVRDLPHDLVEAFRSTLEEAVDTDLLIHVVDAAADDPEQQIGSVRETLQEIGAHQLPELLVLNKSDAADPIALQRLRALHPGAVVVSAVSGAGLDELKERLEALLIAPNFDFEVLVPFDRGEVVALIHRVGEVLVESHEPGGTRIKGRVPERYAEAVRGFRI